MELICDVTADPEGTVRWELMKDDVVVPMDYRHNTDDKHTHRLVIIIFMIFNCLSSCKFG